MGVMEICGKISVRWNRAEKLFGLRWWEWRRGAGETTNSSPIGKNDNLIGLQQNLISFIEIYVPSVDDYDYVFDKALDFIQLFVEDDKIEEM